MEIYEEVLRLKKEGRSSALATIVQCIGSSPRKEGAKMLVRDDGTIMGTLGGGSLEARVIHSSLSAIKEGSPEQYPSSLPGGRGSSHAVVRCLCISNRSFRNPISSS